MRRSPRLLNGFTSAIGRRLAIVPLLLVACASDTLAQDALAPACRVADKSVTYGTPPLPSPLTFPLTYPMISDRYAVQYKVGFGAWTDAKVYISYYGGTTSSPFNSASPYTTENSMSFVSIPVRALNLVQLRVTKLIDFGFTASDRVSVRPSAKLVGVDLESNGQVRLSTVTGWDFAGDQFLLWWGDAVKGGAVEGLAFFLDPPYSKPAGKVKTVTTFSDLADVSQYDGLDFEGPVTFPHDGAYAFVVPANINNVYLAPGSWVQGKLRFEQSTVGNVRRIYGPGVLDVSRFEYDLRACSDDPNKQFADQGYEALSWEDLEFPNKQTPDRFVLDGIVVTDHNHATADLLVDGVVNNVKSIGWNGLNGGFRIGDNTRVSNVFLRSCDDSLMMWGIDDLVTNATVWQNYNGAVVNLGWGAKTQGDGSLIDGLFVVKTDWLNPAFVDSSSWLTDTTGRDTLDGQNNAVIASLMVPGTMFGQVKTPVYRNIVVEDPPRTLFSLKITSPQCNDKDGPRDGNCTPALLGSDSLLNLRIENVFTPPSLVENSIGFQTVDGTALTGVMHIALANVFVRQPDGTVRLLTGANPDVVGGVTTRGDRVYVRYSF